MPTLAEYAGNYRSIEYTQFTLNGLKAGGMTVGPAGDKLVSDLKKIGVTMTVRMAGKDRRRRQERLSMPSKL